MINYVRCVSISENIQTLECGTGFLLLMFFCTNAYLHIWQELADEDPENKFCYLPYARRKDYWEECIDYAGKKFPGTDWSKSYNWFKRIWQSTERFKTMKILKNKPVSKCKECLAFRKKLMAAPVEEVPRIRRMRRIHFEEVRAERRKYHLARTRAKGDPNFLCIIIDGMDQKKTDVPGASGKRDRDDRDVIKTRIVGAKVHGVGGFFYTLSPDVRHDANVTWTIILDVMEQLKTIDPVRSRAEELWIQMDNAGADNKSKWSLTFGKALVEIGLFQKVMFGFLPVGHTHEDIDQLFSVIAQYLKNHNAHSFEQLTKACKDAFTKMPAWSKRLPVAEVIDCERWLNITNMPSQYMAGIRENYAFQASSDLRHEDATCKWQVKEFMRHHDWIPYLGKCAYSPQRELFHTMPLQWKPIDILHAITQFCSTNGFELKNQELSPIRDTGTIWSKEYQMMHAGAQQLLITYSQQVNFQQSRCHTCVRLLDQKQAHPVGQKLPDVLRTQNTKVRQEIQRELLAHRALTSGELKCSELREAVIPDDCVLTKLTSPQPRRQEPPRRRAAIPVPQVRFAIQ
jgi:hypothetical protein